MTQSDGKKNPSRSPASGSRSSSTAGLIGNRLREMYDDVAKEPLPDEFVDLLRKLDDNGEGDDNESA